MLVANIATWKTLEDLIFNSIVFIFAYVQKKDYYRLDGSCTGWMVLKAFTNLDSYHRRSDIWLQKHLWKTIQQVFKCSLSCCTKEHSEKTSVLRLSGLSQHGAKNNNAYWCELSTTATHSDAFKCSWTPSSIIGASIHLSSTYRVERKVKARAPLVSSNPYCLK